MQFFSKFNDKHDKPSKQDVISSLSVTKPVFIDTHLVYSSSVFRAQLLAILSKEYANGRTEIIRFTMT